MGKKTLKWGKGYAWNPVSFIDRPKDPDEPDLALGGILGPFRRFHPELLRSAEDPFLHPGISAGPGENQRSNSATKEKANLAAKLYLLLYDTDIDFIVFTGGSRTTRYGVDFSRNITSNFEVHGEFAYIEDFQKRYLDARGNILSSTYDAASYLLGIRYLSERETTYILEYYRNGTGFTEGEFQDFYRFVDRAYNQYLATGSEALLGRAVNLSQGNYGRPNPMKRLSLPAGQPEGALRYPLFYPRPDDDRES